MSFLGFKFCERFVVYFVTNILFSICNLYSSEELTEEDGIGEELLNKKKLIELSNNSLEEMTKKTELLLELKGLAPNPEVL